MKRLLLVLIVLSFSQSVLAWNGTGHQVIAGIAWDNMTPNARQRSIALLQAAPENACLLDLFPNNNPSDVREREFFMRAATWPDVVRPRQNDTRPCTSFHRRDWHFINFFWSGRSGTTGGSAPRDRPDFPVPQMNAVDRLTFFRPFVMCDAPGCGSTAEERATTLAWILHLVGDIHQPLHTSARVAPPNAPNGDQGGNLFRLGTGQNPPTLHGFWDNILDDQIDREPNERNIDYFDRLIEMITQENPRSALAGQIRPAEFDAWAREGFDTTKRTLYPQSLREAQFPSQTYANTALNASKPAIALGGYRLADLMNRMFDP